MWVFPQRQQSCTSQQVQAGHSNRGGTRRTCHQSCTSIPEGAGLAQQQRWNAGNLCASVPAAPAANHLLWVFPARFCVSLHTGLEVGSSYISHLSYMVW